MYGAQKIYGEHIRAKSTLFAGTLCTWYMLVEQKPGLVFEQFVIFLIEQAPAQPAIVGALERALGVRGREGPWTDRHSHPSLREGRERECYRIIEPQEVL